MITSQFRIGQLVADLRKGADDEEIREKYGLAQDILERIKDALVRRGLLPNKRRQSRQTPGAADQNGNHKKSMDAKQFLLSFRENPDDFHMMKALSLKPAQLKLIYKLLIEKGLLSQYEYYHRVNKAPELEEPAENLLPVSTQLSLIEDVSDATRRLFSLEHSGRVLGSPADGSAPGKSSCPKCSKPVAPSSADACVYCGVVFSKVMQRSTGKGITVWDNDFYLR